MTKKFAKLFDIEDVGQVLVELTSHDGAPAVRFRGPDRHGVEVATNYTFDDTEEGWEEASQAFESVDETAACEAVARMSRMIDKMVSQEAA